MGIRLPTKKPIEKKTEDETGSFAFRIKIGEHEVEIKGTYEEVTKAIENLPNFVPNIHKALENLQPKTVATLTVKTEAQPKPSSEEPAESVSENNHSEELRGSSFQDFGERIGENGDRERWRS